MGDFAIPDFHFWKVIVQRFVADRSDRAQTVEMYRDEFITVRTAHGELHRKTATPKRPFVGTRYRRDNKTHAYATEISY